MTELNQWNENTYEKKSSNGNHKLFCKYFRYLFAIIVG